MSTPVLLLLFALVAPSLAGRLPYIIGGTVVTDASKFPWQGSLQVSSHSCGFAIISNSWAVTAAHCVGFSPSWYTLAVGSTKWRSPAQKVSASQITLHPNYESSSCPAGAGSIACDIAVMKFRTPLTLNDNVKAITMANTGADHTNKYCDITGWGVTTTGGGSVVNDLRHAEIRVFSQSECRGKWPNSINDGHVCVGEVNKGACNGDSGGPLSCTNQQGSTLVGVTSWGLVGCYTTRPSVYTRIAFFREWIRGQTGV